MSSVLFETKCIFDEYLAMSVSLECSLKKEEEKQSYSYVFEYLLPIHIMSKKVCLALVKQKIRP